MKMCSTAAVALTFFLNSTLKAESDTLEPKKKDTFPHIEYRIDVEFETNNVLDINPNNPDDDTDDLFTTIEPFVAFNILPKLSVEAGLVIEPVLGLDPSESRYFGDHGLFVEQLYITYNAGPWSIFGGKFNPSFGKAWDIAPGVFGTAPAENFYEQTEFNGLGGSLVFGAEGFSSQNTSKHTLTGQVFTADTSNFSNSAITRRGELTTTDGGPGNTGDLGSFSVSLDGENLPGLPFDLNYHLGLLHREASATETDDEFAIAVAFYGGIDITEHLRSEGIIEYVHFDNADGIDQQRDFVTISNALAFNHNNVAISYTGISSDSSIIGIDDVDIQQFQVSAGREFELRSGFRFDINIAYAYLETETNGISLEQHIFGAILHFAMEGGPH